MRIKINAKNAGAIEQALADVNGNARWHTFTDYNEVEQCAEDAERRCGFLGIPKKHRRHATAVYTSGDTVPNSYGSKRIATRIGLYRRPTGWYLVSVERTEIWREPRRAERQSLNLRTSHWGQVLKNLSRACGAPLPTSAIDCAIVRGGSWGDDGYHLSALNKEVL